VYWDGYEEPIPVCIEMFLDLTESVILNENPEEHHSENNPQYIRCFDREYLENKVYTVVWLAKSLTMIPRHKTTNYHIPVKKRHVVQCIQMK
jgi:hypothetical protein